MESNTKDVKSEEVVQLNLLLQIAARTQNWDVVGIKPKKNCNSCYGRGYLGRQAVRDIYMPERNKDLDIYVLCPKCVTTSQQVLKSFGFVREVQAILESTKKEFSEDMPEIKGDKQ